jgi:carbamoylphosphate synthase large subunit
LDWTRLHAANHIFDPGASPPPAPVILSRIAMSSFLREAEHPIFYAQSLFEHWEGQGARVLNGPALHIDTSKARQLSLIRRLGYGAPETRVVHRVADIARAAETLRYPILVKADIGGSGAGIVRYDTPAELADALAAGTTPVGVNGVALVQEYAPIRGGRIVRVETLNGRFLYAVSVESGGFDLCLADVCMIAPGKASLQIEAVTPPAEVIAAAEAIARAGRLDVGGVEYLIDDRDGAVKFYDINALSNFVAQPVEVLGFDPHDKLIDLMVETIASQRKAAA